MTLDDLELENRDFLDLLAISSSEIHLDKHRKAAYKIFSIERKF